jgi:hypothetical protein
MCPLRILYAFLMVAVLRLLLVLTVAYIRDTRPYINFQDLKTKQIKALGQNRNLSVVIGLMCFR